MEPVDVAGIFDPLGPTVRVAELPSGRSVHFIDEGDPAWPVLLFFGGAGTTARAFGLLEFAFSLRKQLQIRVVSVERNGLGQSLFDADVGFAQYAEDVWLLADALGIADVAIVAISGGGPYSAHVAAAQPDRVRSYHLACTVAAAFEAQLPPAFSAEGIAADPVAWWTFPDDSPTRKIPGFTDSVIEEALRGVFMGGSQIDIRGLEQAWALLSQDPLPELGSVTAPAFTYWGTEDPLVPVSHEQIWRKRLTAASSVTSRLYPGEAHDVQYRHWDQILADVAYLGEYLVVSQAGRTWLHPGSELPSGAALGMSAWSG